MKYLIFWVVCFKKYFIIFTILLAFTSLHPETRLNWFYFDFGIGGDYTTLKFIEKEQNFEIEGLFESSFDYITGPNFNFKAGCKLSGQIILITNIQTLKINETINYTAPEPRLFGQPRIVDYTLEIKRINYFGFGLIVYPHSRYQLEGSIGFSSSIYTERIKQNINHLSRNTGWLNEAYNFAVAYEKPFNEVYWLVGFRYFHAEIGHFELFRHYAPRYSVSSVGAYVKIRY